MLFGQKKLLYSLNIQFDEYYLRKHFYYNQTFKKNSYQWFEPTLQVTIGKVEMCHREKMKNKSDRTLGQQRSA